jgi:D-aminopeptidase
MTAFQKGPRNTLTDVAGVRVGHLTQISGSASARGLRTGLTAIFTRPLKGQQMRPAAAVSAGGMVELTGLAVLDDFGFLMTPIVATSLRAVGRVHDTMVGRRYEMDLGWPPVIVGFNDARLNQQRTVPFTEHEVAAALAAATDAPVVEGAVGVGAGLVAFGYKSGIGSASRVLSAGDRNYTVGSLVALNMGRRDALRIPSTPAVQSGAGGAAAVQGSALVVTATDAPLDDRQCRHLAASGLMGLGRLGITPGAHDGVVSIAVTTGVLLTRNDRASPVIQIQLLADGPLSSAAAAAAEAVEESALRSLTGVAATDGTRDYPVFRTAG